MVVERGKGLCYPRLLLDELEPSGIAHDLKVVPVLAHRLLDRSAAIREREHSHDLREVGV